MKRNKTGWMAALAAAVALWAGMAWGAVGVTNVTVQQRYPWNGLVDIDYEVVCDDATADVYVMPTGYDGDLGKVVMMSNLSGEGVNGPVKAGKHRMTWDMGSGNKDFHSSAFSVKFTAVSGVPQYLVVDMGNGLNGTWTVSQLEEVPEGGWTDEYKTTKLVLKIIPPGTFMMGSPEAEGGRNANEVQHAVTLTKPFYMGVFEVTQKQWQLALDTWPSGFTGNARPVENVSYNTIRDSFLPVVRAKTGLAFDLPTEAQWEYACRAGTGTAFNNGKPLTGLTSCANLAEVGRYASNQSDGKGGYTSYHTKVGSYLPNAWGLYDMHGNVCEWCLDWYGDYASGAATDPAGPSSGSGRVLRGGSWGNGARSCRSAQRYSYSPSSYDYRSYGFRLACSAGL